MDMQQIQMELGNDVINDNFINDEFINSAIAKVDHTVADNNREVMLSDMPSLDQYLTKDISIFEVVRRYIVDLRAYGKKTNNKLELYHAAFLQKYLGIITDTSFAEDIQNDLSEKFADEIYHSKSDYSFAIRGRIKSLTRLEAKFNDYVQTFIIDYFKEHNVAPTEDEIISHLSRFRDMVAFRFILQNKEHKEDLSIKKLIEIANTIPGYFDSESMDPESKGGYDLLEAPHLQQTLSSNPSMLSEGVRAYYKDYVSNPKEFGFQALVIVMRHNMSGQLFELQLETFEMLKHNEHSEESHHDNYERTQSSRRISASLPSGKSCKFFDEAHQRIIRLEELDISSVQVDMFHAFNEFDIEDLCGLVYGRKVDPREFL